MARRLSRRSLAGYVADQLVSGNKDVIRQLAGYLIEARRTDEARLIVRDIQYLLAQRGTVVGTVTSAYALDAESLEAIIASVKHMTHATTVSLAQAVDPALIGGYRVSLPGRDIDHSVKQQLTVLRTRLKKV